MPSYRKTIVKSKIKKIKPKKSIFKKPWFWILFLLSSIIIASVYFLVFHNNFQIKNIFISGNEKIKTQELESIISGKINISFIDFPFLNIKSKSIFLVNSKKINKKLVEDFPLIEKSEIKKIFPGIIEVNIIERKPIAVYCDYYQTENQQCFLIDKNGIVFEHISSENSYLENGGKFFIVRQNNQEKQAFVSEMIIGKNIISSLIKIQENLNNNFQISIKEAFLPNPLRLDVETSEGWKIFFNLEPNLSIDSQILRLKLLLKEEISPPNRHILEYIDLRFKDRAQVMPKEAIR